MRQSHSPHRVYVSFRFVVQVCVCVDDAGVFATTSGREHALFAAAMGGASHHHVKVVTDEMTRQAVTFAFCDATTRAAVSREVERRWAATMTRRGRVWDASTSVLVVVGMASGVWLAMRGARA